MQVIVDKHTVTIIKNEIVNEGEYNVQSCNFQFSSDYDGLPKIAIFKTGTVTKQIMLSGNTCITPEEVLQTTGIVGLGVYAYQTDGDNLTLRYSPTPAVFTVEPGSYDEGDTPTPPTPSVIEQLQEEITQNANNITSLENVTATHTTQIGTLQTDVNNIKTEQITQNTNISKNADDIATLNNNLTNYSLITETGSQIVLNVNPSNYQMTAILKDKNGNTIYTSNVIDLPIESMIVNVTYDSTTKEIVFTLQNGTTLRVSVADLVSGLVSTDELNTILASYYTKTEIDNLLSGKVDTTTYTQGQATQDTNIQNNADSIENIESLIEQMPTVSGQGTDISLQDVYNYRLMKFLSQGSSSQDGEPTPTTLVPVKSVTGENSLVISNADNTETQNYQLSLGDIELNSTPDGTIRDAIIGKPNEWFKREYIGKIVFDGSNDEKWTFDFNRCIRRTDNTVMGNESISSIPNVFSNYFKQALQIDIQNGTIDYGIGTRSSGVKGFVIRNKDCNNLDEYKQWLSIHNTIVYYVLATPQDIPITDQTLINQLNDIYNNAHSYNGVTNITTTYEDGNEQMYLDIEVLAKGGSTTTETDPTVPSYVKEITQQNITDWNDKQDELVSGTNIKTINNESLLGSGNITIQGGGSSYTAGTNIEITNENVINNKIPFKSEYNGIFLGSGQVAYNQPTNSLNIAIGNNLQAGYNSGTIKNVIIGAQGGISATNRAVENSVVIGTSAYVNYSNSIVIGTGAKATESNQAIFGGSKSPINKMEIYTSNGAKEIATTDFLTTLSGYDATKTQILKNVQGTLTWVDE